MPVIPLIGYADRLSVRPGERIEFKISSQADDPYEADLVRVRCADPNPAGPGIRVEPLPSDFAGSYPSRHQAIHSGSYARSVWPSTAPILGDFTLAATIWPTLTPASAQPTGILSCAAADGTPGVSLALGADGITARIDGVDILTVGTPLQLRTWYHVWLGYDAAAGRLIVGQQPVDRTNLMAAKALAEAALDAPPDMTAISTIFIAALGGDPVRGHFNGKIEAPAVHGGVVGPGDSEPIARWDFSLGMETTVVTDTGAHGAHGELVNSPARAMTGSNWSGRGMCWRHVPDEYGAIHFHDDDLTDCEWETDFTYDVPDDLPSGVYAARLRQGENEDTIPFFVPPPKGTTTADLCVIIPTFTYVIYANQARPDHGLEWHQRAREWPAAYPHNATDHPEYGLSTYNFHGDGSGICHASRHRPNIGMRIGYFPIPEPRGSGLRHFQADTHLLYWLERRGHAFDIITDQEVHDEGVAVLAPYRAVLTATHPEYHTVETLDALTAYRDGGGRFCYLGGNGFYWRVALHLDDPGIIEVRRAETGIRAWAAEPGEYYHAFDAAYGGIWRRNGRPPQLLAGVGFSSQGLFESSYYRRLPAADDARASWIFENVDDDVLGDFGLCGGGAAGYELDRADRRLGTPPHALVVATSQGHDPAAFVLVPEEILTHVATWPGEPVADLIRADMTFFEAPNGGAVFSVGSITFCGSLNWNDGDNNIARILGNVIDRFLDTEATFSIPTL